MTSPEGPLFGSQLPAQSIAARPSSGRDSAPRSEGGPKAPRPLVPLLASDRQFSGLVDYIEPSRRLDDIILSSENRTALDSLVNEFRHAEKLRRHALVPRSRILFCGSPGCGKTLAAEVFAHQVGLPLFIARLDAIVSSFLGETATNLRKLFDEVSRKPAVLFLDEFDTFAHARRDANEHSEMRRVVNVLLMLVDNYRTRGFLIAATNLHDKIDSALWRRFDEVLFFGLPGERAIKEMLRLKTKNFPADFDLLKKSTKLKGLSFADIDRICIDSIKRSILSDDKRISEINFDSAIREEQRRQKARTEIERRRA